MPQSGSISFLNRFRCSLIETALSKFKSDSTIGHLNSMIICALLKVLEEISHTSNFSQSNLHDLLLLNYRVNFHPVNSLIRKHPLSSKCARGTHIVFKVQQTEATLRYLFSYQILISQLFMYLIIRICQYSLRCLLFPGIMLGLEELMVV